MHLTLEPQPVAQVLKRETEALHQQVEALLLPCLTSIKNEQDYVATLKMFYGFFHPLEQMVQAYITTTVLPDIAGRRTSLLLLNDLQALGISDAVLPVCDALPEIKNVADAFGAMYVLEGSTLGGKMIAKMLSKNTAFPVPQKALHFFSGYKEKTGVMWTSFLTELNKQQHTNTIATAANDTFLQLKNWMQHSLYL